MRVPWPPRRWWNCSRACPDEHEVLIGLASCQPKLRTAWQSIIAARLQEMGQRRDAESLCAAITELDRAAEAVRKLLPQARLAATGFGELENLLFGCPAEQGPAFPKLLRAIGRTSPYVEGRVAPPVQPLPDINPLTPESNWVPNRLLRPPAETGFLCRWRHFRPHRLAGRFAPPGNRRQRQRRHRPLALGACIRPWALLLAQVVFTQEAWAAEQNAGSLALELADDQENRFDAPARVNVVVTRPTGEEIDCGTLGELIQRVLRQLGVTLLLREDHLKDLDAQLAGVIRQLLHRQIWKFEGRGVKGRPFLLPHPRGILRGLLPDFRRQVFQPWLQPHHRRHPRHRRSMGRRAQTGRLGHMSAAPTLLIGRCSFWPEARDPEAWLRALVALADAASKSGTQSWTSPRALANTVLRGHLSRRGVPGLFGLAPPPPVAADVRRLTSSDPSSESPDTVHAHPARCRPAGVSAPSDSQPSTLNPQPSWQLSADRARISWQPGKPPTIGKPWNNSPCSLLTPQRLAAPGATQAAIGRVAVVALGQTQSLQRPVARRQNAVARQRHRPRRLALRH